MAGRKFVASNQTRGQRLIGTYNVTQDSQQFTVDIPRGPHIESLVVRVSGTFAITTNYTAVRNAAAYYFLRRLDWVLNSNVTLDSVSGPQLAQLYVTRRNYPTLTNPSGFVVAAGYTFDATFVFDRALMDMMRPKDSMLKTDVGISNNQARIQLGALGDMFTGAGVATYTAVTMSVSVVDYQEARDANGNTPSPVYYIKRNGLSINFPAAGNGQQQKLNTGNRLRMASIRVRDGVTGEPNLALLNRIRLQRAGDTRVDMLVNELQRLNQMAYGVALLTGQIVIDFANNGQLGCRYSEFWPIPSSADTYLLFDTTGSATLEIATIEGVDLVSSS
jgi:hypothetical protein